MVDVEQVVRDNIDRTVHMSLATVSGDQPWVSEVHFAYDDTLNLYFRSLASRRHSQEIAANSHVAGSIIDNFPLGATGIVGLYFVGTASLIVDDTEKRRACEIIATRLGGDANALYEEASQPDGHQVYKIAVSEWSVFGRFDADRGAKYSLKWGG